MTNYLAHYGILGQRWGVRRYQNEGGTRTEAGKRREATYRVNDNISLHEAGESKFESMMAKMSKGYRKSLDENIEMKIQAGKKCVGNLELMEKSVDELNVNWIDIDAQERGKHYASQVMDWIVKDAKDRGYSKVTLEVPGTSPDARHIYEKTGFKVTGKVSDDDDIWGGLTGMEYKIK